MADPLHYAVQRSDRTRWKTVLVEATETGAMPVFHDMARVNPKGYFRVVRLSPRGEEPGSGEFDWRLVALYDPKRRMIVDGSGNDLGPVPPAAGAATRGRSVGAAKGPRSPAASPGPRERVAMPMRLYLSTILIGVAGAVLLYVLYGRQQILVWFGATIP